jgi:regulator of RNase E activity RraA
MTYDMSLNERLLRISTATITTVLLKKGIRNVYLRGPKPLRDIRRVAGRAFTLRFVPAREDLATPDSWSSPRSTRAAVEAMTENCIAVVEAVGTQRHLRGASHRPSSLE